MRKNSDISLILLEFMDKKLILAPVCIAKWDFFIDFLTILNYGRFSKIKIAEIWPPVTKEIYECF